MKLKRALERIPADRAAEDRAWAVVRSAFVDARRCRGGGFALVGRWRRSASPQCRGRGAVAAGSGGRERGAALDRDRACGAGVVPAAVVRSAARQWPGRHWVVAADGSKRRLGSWRRLRGRRTGCSSLPRSHDGLAAVEPRDGTVRWSLGRPDVSLPSWGGTRTDYAHRVLQRQLAARRRRRRDRRPIARSRCGACGAGLATGASRCCVRRWVRRRCAERRFGRSSWRAIVSRAACARSRGRPTEPGSRSRRRAACTCLAGERARSSRCERCARSRSRETASSRC